MDLFFVQPESIDAFCYQEVVLPGQILACVLKDALFSALIKLRSLYAGVSGPASDARARLCSRGCV